MYLMYVDESGDCGMVNSPSRHFLLSGLIIHQSYWRCYLDRLIAFRRRMKAVYGLYMREEIHARAFIQKPGTSLIHIPRHNRLAILRGLADEMASLENVDLIHVVVDKMHKHATYDVFTIAWTTLIQRFENTLRHNNFKGPPDDAGIIFPDNTDNKKLQSLLRRLRRFNPIPNLPAFGTGYRNLTLSKIVEDPNFRDSSDSYFVQCADLSAYLLYQQINPCQYFRRQGIRNYFDRLEPILCPYACRGNTRGIVTL